MRDDIFDALAVMRLSKLIRNDVILDRPRTWLLLKTPHKIDQLLACPWCLGVWIGAGAVIARRVAPRQWALVARGLALSYVAALAAVYVEPKAPVPGDEDD